MKRRRRERREEKNPTLKRKKTHFSSSSSSLQVEAKGRLSQFGRVIEGPEGGTIIERKVLTRTGERVSEIERVQRVTTR